MEEGIIDLVIGDNYITRADLSILGWETSALILWIKETSIPSLTKPLDFSPDMVQCGNCSYNLYDELLYPAECGTCQLPFSRLNVSVSLLFPGTIDPLIKLDNVCCSACDNRCFVIQSNGLRCPSCSFNISVGNVRISLKKSLDEKIGEVFGEEIKNLF